MNLYPRAITKLPTNIASQSCLKIVKIPSDIKPEYAFRAHYLTGLAGDRPVSGPGDQLCGTALRWSTHQGRGG